MGQVTNELERMETLGVIAPMKEPAEWCSGMVIVPKPNGQVRICVDLPKLNRSVCREHYPLPAVEQILSQLSEPLYLQNWTLIQVSGRSPSHPNQLD